MKTSRKALCVGGVLLLAGCGGVSEPEQASEALPGRDMGAVMGDGFRQLGLEPVTQGPTQLATVCPTTKLYGVDVSYYQGTVNWASVKSAGKAFALIRVSDGTNTPDPQFATNWSKARAAGLTVGAYQFFRPSQDATAQADLMVSKLTTAGFAATDIPPVIDVEVTEGLASSTILSRVNTWLARVFFNATATTEIYTSPGFWSGLGNPTPSPLPYLWDAHWGASCPTLPPAWGRLRFWQYNDSGSVSGISGAVHLDQYTGPLSELRSL